MFKTLYYLLFLSVILPQFLPAQEMKIVVMDQGAKVPVFGAHAAIHSLSGQLITKRVTNQQGEFSFSKNLPIIASISCMGYKIYQDTIFTDQSDSIFLSPDTYQLNNVVVTGQFRPQPVDKSIYKIELIDSKQISLRAANNVGDLFRTDLNFQYRSEGILGDFLKIRGLSGENIKILVDGMPITGRVADRIDLGQLNLINVDHIEIVEGPMSVLYGSNALAGAINIITTSNSKVQKKRSVGLNSYYETVGTYNFNGFISSRAGKNTFSVNVSRNFFAGWDPVDTSRYKIWKPKLQYLAGGWYQYNKEDMKITLSTDYLHEELRELDSVSPSGRATDFYHFTQRWNSRLNYSNLIYNRFLINFQGGYSFYTVKKITYDNNLVLLEKNKLDEDTNTFHLISARGVVSNVPGKKFEYQAGFDYNFEQAYGAKITGSKDITEAAGFLNIIYNPYKILSLQPGIRGIYNSKYKAPLVYALNVKFNPGNFVIRGSYAKGFKAPSLKQLYLVFIDNNHKIYGSSDLLPEIANNYSISVDYHHIIGSSRIEYEMSLFYNSSKNAIQLAVDIDNPGWGKYFNVENSKYRTQGFETKIAYHFMNSLTLQAGYSLTGRSRLDYPNRFEYSGDIASSLTYHYIPANIDLAVFYKYTDDYLDFNGNFNSDGELSGIAQRYIDPYNIMDVTLSKHLLQNRLTISIGSKNIFNVKLVDSNGTLNYHGSGNKSTAVGYGRTYFLRLNFQIDKY